jgi:hypothetical protein
MSVVWMAGPVALAQTPSPNTSGVEAPVEAGPKTPQPIPPEDVPDRAEATRAELDALLPRDAPRHTLERIGSELDRTLPEVESLLATTQETLAARSGIRTLNESEATLSEMQHRLRPWSDERDLHLVSVSPNPVADRGSERSPAPRPNTTSGSEGES